MLSGSRAGGARARALRGLRTGAAVWGGFAVVHVVLTVVGVLVVPAEAFWDLDLYRWWAATYAGAGPRPVLDAPWVYPPAALLPVLLPGLVSVTSTPGYALAWCALVTALDAVAVRALLRSGPGGRGAVAAWWWLVFQLGLGPVAIGRLDAVVVPLTLLALVAATGRPPRTRTASALLALGAWVKVAPGPLLLPVAAAARHPWRDVVLPALVVSGVVVGTVAAAGGGAHVLAFLGTQGQRGLQLEAVTATPWVLAAVAGGAAPAVLDEELVTYEVPGAAATAVAGALDGVLVAAVAAVAGLLLLARRRGAAVTALLPAALLLTGLLVVANKVGSPQFQAWFAAPVAVLLLRRGDGPDRWVRATAAVALTAAVLTQLVFPWGYPALLQGSAGVAGVLAVRNALVVALVALAGVRVVQAVRLSPRATRSTPAGTPASSRRPPTCPAAGEPPPTPPAPPPHRPATGT